MFLTPRLIGKRIGLHPLALIFAMLAFLQRVGFFGILLALPASVALPASAIVATAPARTASALSRKSVL